MIADRAARTHSTNVHRHPRKSTPRSRSPPPLLLLFLVVFFSVLEVFFYIVGLPVFFSEVVVGPGGFSFSFTSAMESPIRLDLWPSIEAAAFDSVPTEFLPGFPSWGVSKCVRFSPGEGFFSSFFRSPIDSSLLALFSILVARLIRLVNELECQSPIRHDLWPAIESPPAPSAAKLRPGHPCASLRDREAHHEGPSTCLRPRPFSFFFSSPHRPDFRPPPPFSLFLPSSVVFSLIKTFLDVLTLKKSFFSFQTNVDLMEFGISMEKSRFFRQHSTILFLFSFPSQSLRSALLFRNSKRKQFSKRKTKSQPEF